MEHSERTFGPEDQVQGQLDMLAMLMKPRSLAETQESLHEAVKRLARLLDTPLGRPSVQVADATRQVLELSAELHRML